MLSGSRSLLCTSLSILTGRRRGYLAQRLGQTQLSWVLHPRGSLLDSAPFASGTAGSVLQAEKLRWFRPQGEFSQLTGRGGEEAFVPNITRVLFRCFCYQATLGTLSEAAALDSFSLVPGVKAPVS